ncbi:predicted permiase [Malacoplasma penetrans HF-2]|uniref:Predicted permiase n=1 Tax=Malacoplasma penetrans (strain HF-2) TaxID=272633 RepID=Q8EVF1_MALP2|nr:FtsX-like permease family protein [Malacoplasma penetrans]BAC44403.1 predicted permiase [Malacoplasma penetrans HF-2]
MTQLIKQVFKSFKRSVVLLIGLLFIGFAIIFAFFSSLYFTSNIDYSSSSLNSASNLGTSIVSTNSSDLNSSSLSYDIDGAFNEYQKPTSDNNQTSSVYFSSYEEKVQNMDKSFAYTPTYLHHSSFVKDTSSRNYIFAYYNGSTNKDSNPFFTQAGINDANQLYTKRARGVLYSYGIASIPSESSKWRAWGLFLDDSDLQNIVYAVDPLTGETQIDSNQMATTMGYFNDGYLNSTMTVREGNMIYPSNVTATKASDITGNNKAYRYKNGDYYTPFFSSKDDWWVNDFSWDLAQGWDWILQMLQQGADVFNLLPSMSKNIKNTISLSPNINWDLAVFSPYYEYLKILRDGRYLTKNGNSNTDNKPTNGNDIIQFKDYVFNVHLNMNNLSQLERETLNYVKSTYGAKTYNDLVSFVYTVNGSWIKSKLKENVDSSQTTNVDNNSFETLSDLNTQYTLRSNDKEKISAKDIVKAWIRNYSESKLSELSSSLLTYEKEYIASKLSTVSNIEFNNQRSYTISDSKSSITYLVSRKDYDPTNDKYQSNNVNKLVMTSGTRLENSYKYLDAANSLFNTVEDTTSRIPAVEPDNKEINSYALNANGNYLMNLVKFTNESIVAGITDVPIIDGMASDYQTVRNLAANILNQYGIGDTPSTTAPSVNANDYYHLFSIVSPDFSKDNIVTTNDQNISLSIQVKWGGAPAHFPGSVTYVTPYGSAVVTTQKWLELNKKSIVDPQEWAKAVYMDSADYVEWLNNLSDDKKIVINSKSFAIIGTGISAENAYPVTSITNPLPNFSTESLIYLNDQGYRTILATSSLITEDSYFAVASTNNSDNLASVQSAVRNLVSTPYSSNDIVNNNNLLTMRIGVPKMMTTYIQIFTSILIVVISIIGVYLCYLLIKIYIEKNQISLAIAKANGVSSLKIIFAVSMFGLVVAVFAGIVGYLSALFLQSIFLGVIGNYWFIPISQHLFSPIGFISGTAIIYLAFLLFVSLGVWKTFRKPINDLLSITTELKINKFLYLLKSSFTNASVISRFRIGLSFTKMSRFFLLVLLCSVGISFISTGVSIPQKFTKSQTDTQNSINYKYSFDLQTPTQQTGLYKVQDYADLGITDESLGIYSMYANKNYTGYTDPYQTLFEKEGSSGKDLLALRDSSGNVIEYTNSDGTKYKRYFTNLLLPSYIAQFGIQKDPHFFRNSVGTKWLLDYTINIASLSLNIWDFVSSSFSSDLISRIDALSNDFVNQIMAATDANGNTYLAEKNEIGNGTVDNPKPFLSLDTNGIWQINASNVMSSLNATNVDDIRFNDEFLKFIGMVYGNKELSAADSKMAFGIVPFNNLNDESNNQTETYTYLTSTFNSPNITIPASKNDGISKLSGIDVEILGIKENSKYVKLIDEDENNISSLLSTTSASADGNTVYPVIINVGSAYKYGLKVGQEFDVLVSNTYDRYTKKIAGEDPSVDVKFKVVGISADSFGAQFYTNQEYANKILGLNFDQGAIIYGTSKKTQWNQVEATILGDESLMAKEEVNIESNGDHKFKVNYVAPPSNYVPFNGIFTAEETPLQTSSLTLEMVSGIWGNYNYFKRGDAINASFNNYFVSGDSSIGDILNAVIPYDQKTLSVLIEKFKTANPNYFASITVDDTNRRTTVLSYLRTTYNSVSSLAELLQTTFGNNNMVAIQNLTYFDILFGTYTTIFNSLLTVENMLIILIVPIIIFTIMIISSTTLNDFRKMLAVLKTLGYKDREILNSIIVSYLLILLVSIGIGIGLLAGLLTVFQLLIFNLSSIFLTSAISWIPFVFGASGILAILIFNILYITVLFKKQNLRNSID